MHIAPETLLDALHSQGLRVTRARRAMCAVVAQRHREHLTAASILEEVEADPRTNDDQSTACRTLDALEAAGALVHSQLGHGAAVYHLASETAHQHIICSHCGATAAVPAGGLSNWRKISAGTPVSRSTQPGRELGVQSRYETGH